MKPRLTEIWLIVALATFGCSSNAVSTPRASTPDPPTPPITPEFVPSAIPITATYEGCAYVWASKDMPQLSRSFNAELQALSKDATGLAYAYGEDCVYADGHSTFSAQETDFRVGITVTSAHDEEALGNWIEQVMQLVLAIPESQLLGPQPGRVDFNFKQPDPAEIFVTVPIAKYQSEAQGLHGAELFRFFYTGP